MDDGVQLVRDGHVIGLEGGRARERRAHGRAIAAGVAGLGYHDDEESKIRARSIRIAVRLRRNELVEQPCLPLYTARSEMTSWTTP